MAVTSPGHYECECGPHGFALAVEVIFWHLIKGLVWVHHLAVYLLSQSEGLLKFIHHHGNSRNLDLGLYLRWGEHCLMNMFSALFTHTDGNPGIWVKILLWHDKAQNNAHFLYAASWWSNVSRLLFLMALLKRFLWTFHRLFMIPIVMLNTGGLWLLRSDACFRLTGLSQHSGVWFGAKSLTKLHCALTYVLYDTTT